MSAELHDHLSDGHNGQEGLGYYARRILAIKDLLMDKGLLKEHELGS